MGVVTDTIALSAAGPLREGVDDFCGSRAERVEVEEFWGGECGLDSEGLGSVLFCGGSFATVKLALSPWDSEGMASDLLLDASMSLVF